MGLGVGEQHARAYLIDGRCRLCWLYDLDVDRARELSRRLGCGVIATDLDEILADPEVDIISIASYDDDHYDQVIEALSAHKHVFVEKPLCHTLDEIRTIKKVWVEHRGKIKLSCNLILRAAPMYLWLKEKLSAGDFGQIYAFDGDYLYGRLWKITEGWRKNIDNYSVMQGGGIHLIDLMLWLTEEKPSLVFAMGNRIVTQRTAFRYNDYMAMMTESPSGMAGRISANFGCIHRHQHVVRLFGTKASFIYDDAGARLHLTRDPEVVACTVKTAALPSTKGYLIPQFVSAVLNDEDINQDTQSFFDGICISIACNKAVQSRRVEEVEYV